MTPHRPGRAPFRGYAMLLLAAAAAVCAPLAAEGVTTAANKPGDSPAAASHDIERFLNIRSAWSAGISPDGGTIAFLTNITGSNQIWTVAAAGGWPDQVTYFDDRVAAVDWSPEGSWIAFSKDRGGDENYQLHLVSPDGSRQAALTSQPEVRHNFGSWSKDGRLIAYAGNARDPRYFDLYVMDVETREARLVLQRDGRWSAGPFARDGRRLLASRSNGSLDNDLFVVDLAAGPSAEPKHLTPHEGRAVYRPIDWSADDRSIWIVSEAGREFAALARLEAAAGGLVWVREPPWDVAGAALSPEGKRLAYVVNEDGYDTLRLLDTVTLTDLTVPAAVRGGIGGLAFDRNGLRLSLSLESATSNPNVWLLDLANGGARQVTRASTGGIPSAVFVEPGLVRYRTFDGLEVPAFFYEARRGGAAGRVPCLVMPHGGPEGQWTARFNPMIQYYVNHGYAVLAPNVRGSTGYGRTFTHLDDVHKREDSVKDLVAGVEWLKASGRIDPSRIGVVGGSYGGYMTLAAATLYPDLWGAAVDLFGIANFRTFLEKTAAYRVIERASEYGDPVKDAGFLDSISPVHRIDRIKAPLLVLQGANDPRVPRAESERLVEAIRGRGGVVEYILFPDEGHGWTKQANRITAARATVDFLDRHLRGKDSGER